MPITKVCRLFYHLVTNPCHISCLNRWAPLWCLLTIGGVWWYGHTEVTPKLFEDFPQYWTTFSQIFAHVVLMEAFINWLCVRYVDSSYSPSVHGVQKNVSSSSEEPPAKENPDNGICNNNEVKMSEKKSTYVMYVMSGIKNSGLPHRTAHPYWSWVPCIICNHYRPPRCHHCSLCKNCILKRDHHCFFVGSCIGYRNMRHFIVFCFWTTIGAFFFLILSGFHYYYILMEQTTFWDLLPVFVHIRWYLGNTIGGTTVFVSLVWSVIFFFPLAAHFFCVNMDMILKGQTTFERDNHICVFDDRSVKHKLQSVFGRYWFINFIVPLHTIFPTLEDPVYWPHVHQ